MEQDTAGAVAWRMAHEAVVHYLLLWHRIPLSELTVVGDKELATAFLTWPDLS